MDAELRRLIREHYPCPIAHAHQKTLACLDDDAHKLQCLLQMAETTVQFLALVPAKVAMGMHCLEHRPRAYGRPEVCPWTFTQVLDDTCWPDRVME